MASYLMRLRNNEPGEIMEIVKSSMTEEAARILAQGWLRDLADLNPRATLIALDLTVNFTVHLPMAARTPAPEDAK